MIIWILMLFSVALCGQNQNPFELKNRLEKNKTKSENPFDVTLRSDTIRPGNPSSVIRTDSTPIANFAENPFEVDHTPIRISTLREESAVKSRARRQNAIKNQADTGGHGLLVFLVGLISLLLIAVVANTRRSIFTKVVRSFFNDNYLKLTQREENGGLNGAYMILYAIYVMNAGIFLYLIIKFFQPSAHLQWWLCMLLVLTVYLGRHFFLFLFSEIFPVGREVKQYNFIIATFNLIIGLILVPLNLIIAYTSPSIGTVAIYTTLAIIAFIFFIRYSKGFLLGLISSGGALFNFLLYLCTFEIVPLLIFIKLARDFGSIL